MDCFREIDVLDMKKVVQYIEGQRLPLSKLTQALRKAFYGDNEKHNDHIQPMICDVAKRRFYGPKNGKHLK